MKHDRQQKAVVRAEVRRILAGSPSFRALPEATRSRLADGMIRVAMFVADADDPAATSVEVARVLRDAVRGPRALAGGRDGLRASLAARVGRSGGSAAAVDFPEFVAGLVQGTFQSVVDASVQQMEAYGELLHDVAAGVEKFVDESDDDDDD